MSEFQVLKFTEFSNHEPLYFLFSFKSKSLTRHGKIPEKHADNCGKQIKFDDAKVSIFRSQLMNNYEDFQRMVDNVTTDPIDYTLSRFKNEALFQGPYFLTVMAKNKDF